MKLSEEFKKKSTRVMLVFAGSIIIGLGIDRVFGLPHMFKGNIHKIVGWILLIIGFALPSISGRNLTVKGRDKDLPRGITDKLVTNGIYSYVRHPAFDGFILILMGLAPLINSYGYAAMALVDICLIIYFALAIEEKENYEKFGETYLEYKKRVPPFIPKIKRK